MSKEKWYKVISKDLKAKDGGGFNYTSFVKSKKWLPKIKSLKMCRCGYHVTKYWNMFFDSDSCRVFEVEPKGLLEQEDLVGVAEKAVCSSFRIIKEFKPKFDKKNNTGYRNTGDSNTGNWNTGSCHVGAFNTKEAEIVYLFDKQIKKNNFDKIKFPSYFYFEFEKDYKKSWKKAFENASVEEVKNTIELPNFCYNVFSKITGITRVMIKKKLKKGN